MSVLITICARGGSKGIPGKNIKPLNGIPLIAYTIQIAREFAALHDGELALSTDDEAIKAVARTYGIDTAYTRPAALATDTTGKIETIRDLVNFQQKHFDYILDLDVTSPLRTLKDLEDAFALLRKDPKAINLFSVNAAARNPYFNMVEQKENGYFGLVKSSNDVFSRQAAPQVFDLNASFYFYKRAYFEMNLNTVFTPASLIYEMPHLCFDLDHVLDFDFLDYLLKNDKLDFQLWR